VSRSGEAVQISSAQLGYLLEGIDWRNPRWTQRPAKGFKFETDGAGQGSMYAVSSFVQEPS
jgi:hypothetical protein